MSDKSTTDAAGQPRLFGLTADEWLDLASSDNAEVGPCCGNISALREYLQILAGYQDESYARMAATEIFEAYEAAISGHDHLTDPSRFPLLHRVLTALAALTGVTHQPQGHSDDRADKLASAVSGFTSSGVGKKVALSHAIERAAHEQTPDGSLPDADN